MHILTFERFHYIQFECKYELNLSQLLTYLKTFFISFTIHVHIIHFHVDGHREKTSFCSLFFVFKLGINVLYLTPKKDKIVTFDTLQMLL